MKLSAKPFVVPFLEHWNLSSGGFFDSKTWLTIESRGMTVRKQNKKKEGIKYDAISTI